MPVFFDWELQKGAIAYICDIYMVIIPKKYTMCQAVRGGDEKQMNY